MTAISLQAAYERSKRDETFLLEKTSIPTEKPFYTISYRS